MAITMINHRSSWKAGNDRPETPDSGAMAIAEVECTEDIDDTHAQTLYITALWTPQQPDMMLFQGSDLSFWDFFHTEQPEESEVREMNRHVKWYASTAEADRSPLFIRYKEEFHKLRTMILDLLRQQEIGVSIIDF